MRFCTPEDAWYHAAALAALAVAAVDLSLARDTLELDRRLRETPPTALARGVFFNQLRDELRRRGLLGVRELRRIFENPRKNWEYYPARDMIEAYGIAGAVVHADPHEGVRELFFGTASYFSSTWYGRTVTRYLRPDPRGLFDWIERSREYLANYGRWRVEHRGPGHTVIHMIDEYFFIEAAHRGGCEGALLACGVKGTVTAELDSIHTGRLDVRWEARH